MLITLLNFIHLPVRSIRKKQQECYGSCFIGAYRLRNKRKTINHATSICKTGGWCVLRHEKKSHGLLLTSAAAAHSGAIISEVALSAHMNTLYAQ